MKNYRDAVRDHCHITGKYRGAVHNDCNLKLRIKPKTDPIPVVFHNLRGYNAHYLFQAMSKIEGEIRCIPNNMEKYISFSLGSLRFKDSLNFLQASLDSLVKNTPHEKFKYTLKLEKNKLQKMLILKKGVYPYEHKDGWNRFSETKLPDQENFYSALNDQHITDEEYEHALKVWTVFECKNLENYHDF